MVVTDEMLLIATTATSFSNIRQAKALTASRFKRALFDELLNDDVDERAKAIDKITQLVKTCAIDCYPPSPSSKNTILNNDSTVNNRNINSNDGMTPPIPKRSSSSILNDANNKKNPDNYNNNDVDVNNSEKPPLPSPIASPLSPLFTDDSASVPSLSSYNASPNVKEGVPCHDGQQDDEDAKMVMEVMEKTTANDSKSCHDDNDDSKQERKVEIDEEDDSEQEKKDLLKLLILTILRMSIDCPFSDVRHSFSKLLDKLKNIGVPVPIPIHPTPSFYIPPEDILTLEWPQTETITSIYLPSKSPNSSFEDNNLTTCNDQIFSESTSHGINHNDDNGHSQTIIIGKQPDDSIRRLLVDTFVKLGRLSHLYRILSYFPSFMEKFQKSYKLIVRTSTVLPHTWKFYIGIMAASQYKCQYVVSLLRNEYLAHGGDPKWLESLYNAPKKLRNLSTLNTILAHQPWRLKPQHILKLIKGAKDRHENWTIAEIVHVILLLSTFHSLSSYVLGCGIVPEYDSIGGSYEEESLDSSCNANSGDRHHSDNYDHGHDHDNNNNNNNNDCDDNNNDNDNNRAIGLLNNLENVNPNVGAGLGVTIATDDIPSAHSIKDDKDDVSKDDVSKGNSSVVAIDGDYNESSKNDTQTLVKRTNQLIKRLKNKKDLHLYSLPLNINNKNNDNNNEDEPRLSSSYSSSKSRTFGFENCEEETFTNDSPTSEPFFSSIFVDQQQQQQQQQLSSSLSSNSSSLYNYGIKNNTYSQYSHHPSLSSSSTIPPVENQPVEDFSVFLDPPVEIPYEDFNTSSDEYFVFKLQEYSWEDHGVLIVNDYLPGLGESLDEEFQEARELSDYFSLFQSYTQQDIDLDVIPLRQAIWYYVQRLYGLLKDDYDYDDIKNLLTSKFRSFLKKVCCTPEKLTTKDWKNVGFQLRSEEKCHVNLIATESKKQSELIYGLWCVMEYQRELSGRCGEEVD